MKIEYYNKKLYLKFRDKYSWRNSIKSEVSGRKNGRALFDFDYRQCKNGEGAISLIQIAD